MAKALRNMTVKNVDKWLRAGVRAKHLDRGSKDSVRGLMLDIRGDRAASWVLRYQVNNGPTRHMGLGSAFEWTLPEAREQARRERQKLRDKIDPLTVRRAEHAALLTAAAKRLTFAEGAGRWFTKASAEWSSLKHGKNVQDSLAKWVIPLIGTLDVASIDTADVMRVLQQPVDGKGSLWTAHPQTGDRLRNHLKLILDWAAVSGHRDANVPNPARWTGHLEVILPAPSKVAPTQNMASLDYRKVPDLMTRLAGHEGVGARALEFMIMTSCRINEAAGARWDEVNLDEATWTVPATRMKARKEWRQPLSPQVVALLRKLPTEAGNPHIFIGSSSGSAITDSAIRAILRREGLDETPHGFRSSFSTWSHERTAHSNHTIELSLAHAVGTDVEKAYRRTDMLNNRRKLMEDWATYCLSPAPAGAVIPIRQGATA